MALASYTAQAGDGIYTVAGKIATNATWDQRNDFALTLAVANGGDLTNLEGRSIVYDDDDVPGGTSWSTAFASRDVDGTITDWYVANTGHDPALDYMTLSAGTWTVNSTWLTNNEDDDHVYQDGGRWYVERVAVNGMVRVAANNVTFRHINQDGSGGALYGAQSRAVDGPATGTIFEYCTFAGNNGNANGAGINFPANSAAGQTTFRYCDMSGYRAGWYMFAGVTVEYCYAHDLHFTEGSHNTGSSIRGGNCRLYRSLITDGNSAALSLYPEPPEGTGPYTNVLAEENTFRLQNSDTGPEVILAAGRPASTPLEGETRVLRNNLFFRGGNLGVDDEGTLLGGGIGGYLAGFTTISGNIDRNGGPVGE